MSQSFVIVGAGLAGLTVAEALRGEGHVGPITLLGTERHAPYHRPPLSKGFLAGSTAEAQVAMRAPGLLEKKNLTLMTGVGVSDIDRTGARVRLTDGSTLPYDGLAMCAGSRPRALPLPGTDLQGVFDLRTLDDAKAIGAALETARDVVVIGGGFIGLEVAATARGKGKKVTVLEAMDRLMARVATPAISQFFLDLHRGHGTDVVTGAAVSELIGAGGRIAAVRIRDGRTFPADLLLVGIGVLPNAEISQSAGLEVQGGIVVDACGRTNDSAIVAAGDCTVRRMEDGSYRRLESVHNAVEQGKAAAAALLGNERPFTATPWFWSDQYDIKLQMAGLSADFDHCVMRGSMAEKKFSVFYYQRERLIAIDSVNQPAVHMTGRKLLDRQRAPTPQQAAEDGFALDSLLA
jgi:3-phenylpropionate/trans-cinnamate dioxygenase ferredoxin reductase component